nr:skin secretory protein xP2-like [Setaria viridis]
MIEVVALRPLVPEDAERRRQNCLLAEKQKRRKDKEMARKRKRAAKELQSVAPRDFVPLLVPKKALRVSTASTGRSMTPPAAGDSVAEKAMGPPMEVASVAATGGGVPQSSTEQGPSPVPPPASAANPAGQDAIPRVPPPGEVINLDDEAEDEPVGEASASEASAVGAATTSVETATVAKMVAPAPAAAAAETAARAPATVTTMGTAAVAPAPVAMTGAAVSRAVAVGGLEDDLARLRDVIDAERTKHANLWDAVCIICDDLGMV